MVLQDYVVEKWDEVSTSDEFEQCCQEVASGEYAFIWLVWAMAILALTITLHRSQVGP